MNRPFRSAVALALALGAPGLVCGQSGRLVWTSSVQTGVADTFQLNLGGTFGAGPAWQSRVSTGLANAFRPGDLISVYAANSLDLPSSINNRQAGIGYRLPVWRSRHHLLALGSGVQKWLFPGVKSGTNDWLIAGSLVYQAQARRVSFLVNEDSWSIVKSPLPAGSLLLTQGWVQWNLLQRERFRVHFKQGPAYTYSWGFWGAEGSRIYRYQTMVSLLWKNHAIEGGYRKQFGLQSGIRDNRYWQFSWTRTFDRPVR